MDIVHRFLRLGFAGLPRITARDRAQPECRRFGAVRLGWRQIAGSGCKSIRAHLGRTSGARTWTASRLTGCLVQPRPQNIAQSTKFDHERVKVPGWRWLAEAP